MGTVMVAVRVQVPTCLIWTREALGCFRTSAAVCLFHNQLLPSRHIVGTTAFDERYVDCMHVQYHTAPTTLDVEGVVVRVEHTAQPQMAHARHDITIQVHL